MRSLMKLPPAARPRARRPKLRYMVVLFALLSFGMVAFSYLSVSEEAKEERRRLGGCPTSKWDKDENEKKFQNHKKDMTPAVKKAYRKKHYKKSPAGGGYPDDLFLDADYRCSDNKWSIIFHFMGTFYMLLGLSVICDEYFVGALEAMVDRWEVKPDVAGATFMAAGGSAPELFTSVMGVFVSKNDVGFGTIVGSAVFNVLFVIGLCALLTGTSMALTWWPLFRDCSYYIFGLVVLAFCVEDENVTAWEAAILFSLYIGYITLMYFNPTLEARAYAYYEQGHNPCVAPAPGSPEKKQEEKDAAVGVEMADRAESSPGSPSRPPMMGSLERSASARMSIRNLEDLEKKGIGGAKVKSALLAAKSQESTHAAVTPRGTSGDAAATAAEVEAAAAAALEAAEAGTNGNGGDGDDDDEGDYEPLEIPEGTSDRVVWFLCLPVTASLWLTVPDCRREDRVKYMLATFGLSLFWIAFYSYFLVWWATIIGDVLHIPTVVMGLTFLAAGTSIPDALSSVAVARAGEGDMAISSSIGSNVFDILVGLPIPWLLQTACVKPGSSIEVQSPFLVVQVLLLMFMVGAVIMSIRSTGWVLDMKLGWIMFGLYLVFLSVSISMEVLEPEWMKFSLTGQD